MDHYLTLIKEIKEGSYLSALNIAITYAHDAIQFNDVYTPEELEEKLSDYFQWMTQQGAMDSAEAHLEAIVGVMEDMLTMNWNYAQQLLPIFLCEEVIPVLSEAVRTKDL